MHPPLFANRPSSELVEATSLRVVVLHKQWFGASTGVSLCLGDSKIFPKSWRSRKKSLLLVPQHVRLTIAEADFKLEPLLVCMRRLQHPASLFFEALLSCSAQTIIVFAEALLNSQLEKLRVSLLHQHLAAAGTVQQLGQAARWDLS